jgi:hypothetical protein
MALVGPVIRSAWVPITHLQADLNRHFSFGMTLRGVYTWSKLSMTATRGTQPLQKMRQGSLQIQPTRRSTEAQPLMMYATWASLAAPARCPSTGTTASATTQEALQTIWAAARRPTRSSRRKQVFRSRRSSATTSRTTMTPKIPHTCSPNYLHGSVLEGKPTQWQNPLGISGSRLAR